MNYLNAAGGEHIPLMPAEKPDVKSLLNKYFFSRWYLYVLFVGVFVGLAHLYMIKTEPEYEIKSKILLVENKGEGISADDWLKRNLNYAAASENVSNEIERLTSYSLMESVVRELDLEINYYWKHFLEKRTGYGTFPFVVDTFQLASAEYLGLPFQIVPIDSFSFEFYQDSLIGRYGFDTLFTNRYGSFVFHNRNQNPVVRMGDTTLHVSFYDVKAVTQQYLRKLEVRLLGENSSILELSITDAIPERGVLTLNRLIEKYVDLTNEDNIKTALNTLNFIDGRLADVGGNLRRVEGNLEGFKVNNDIAATTTTDLGIVLEDANDLAQQQKDLKLQMEILDLVQPTLNPTDNHYELIPSNVSDMNIRLTSLVEPYNQLILERRQMLETAQASHPSVQSNAQKLKNLKSSIYSTISNMRRDIYLKLQMINSRYAGATRKIQSTPVKERRMVEIEREKSIVEDLYIYMLQKREETSLSLIATPSNSKVIDSPHSSVSPIAPNGMKVYMGGFLGGFALPLVLIVFLDLFKDSVNSKDELKILLPNHDVIETITQVTGRSKRIVIESESRTWISEKFRSLRTNLLFGSEQPTQSILVTSSVSTEGKTFIAINLATSFALGNKKTVILDFDLRNPKMAHYLEEVSEKGLTDYLKGKASIKKIVQVSKTHPNLHYIASGPATADPAELMSEQKLDELFLHLRSFYDVIIVDTPPVGIISDAVLLKKYITHSLFVVKSGFTKKSMVDDAREIFDQEKLVNPYIILNGVKKKDSYSYNYSNYYKNV